MVMNKWLTLITVTFALIVLFSLTNGRYAFATPVVGAVFTTESSCNGTNVNIFNTQDDVYLDGGPAHTGAAGLPDGSYYVQVTEPDGTLLGTSIGSTNNTPVVVTNGSFEKCYQLSVILIKKSNGTQGYDTTSNNGGEYKVWVSSDSAFTNDETKTDNFKVGSSVTPTPSATPSVTVTPSVTPSLTPTATTTPSVTPTVTVTPTPTTDPCANNACVTPTPTPSNNGGNGGSSSNSSTTTTQAVLGASTMAETGTFTENLMNILLIAGIISLAAGSLSYAKENRN